MHLAVLVPDVAAPGKQAAVPSEERSCAAQAFADAVRSELPDAVLAASADEAELVCSMLLVPNWAVVPEPWASELAGLSALLRLARLKLEWMELRAEALQPESPVS